MNRYIRDIIVRDLNKKMVILGGPRQVGKTTLSKSLIQKPEQYLNWDFQPDRTRIKNHEIDTGLKLIVLDEVHKYPRWRGLIKGLYDKTFPDLRILVTGSARLDHYRKGGDSLAGRYYYHRLHPFSLLEADPSAARSTTQKLLQFGGFPEPFLGADDDDHRRWQKERVSRVLFQDVRDLENLKDISLLELLTDLLPARVGSVLSQKSLSEDLQVSPNTVKHWLQILENMYYCFLIHPYGSPKIRAVKKSAKLYLWDWSESENYGPRFENLVASQLLKYCHLLEDTQGFRMELRFIRDTDLRETDFVVLKNRKPVFAVECKTGENRISPHLHYFRERTPVPQFYQVHLGTKDYSDRNIRVLPFEKFCLEMKMP